MADRFSAEVRSKMMSRVRNKNTGPEIIVRKYLHALGYRFRLHVKELPGTPDIVLPKYKTIVLVHGCFWHGHEGCKKSKLPETRREEWERKIKRNKELDLRNKLSLEKANWKVFEVWQCELNEEAWALMPVLNYLGGQKRLFSNKK